MINVTISSWLLKPVFTLLSKYVTEAAFHWRESGLEIGVPDSGNISNVEVNISREVFKTYDINPTSFAIDPNYVALAHIKGNENLTMLGGDGRVVINAGNYSYTIDLLDSSFIREPVTMRHIRYSTHAELPLSELRKGLALPDISLSMRIRFSTGLFFEVQGTARHMLYQANTTRLEGEGTARYSFTYLKDFIDSFKQIAKDRKAWIKLSEPRGGPDNRLVEVGVELVEGAEIMMHLAPRLGED